ncbi:hypothetical protein [Planococcus lenghuensis]|uniref:hypothetical protein n=1 Tax=Planococcus lenghuensis TaxID=2213202 RepID=UPI0012EB9276|nr:hypothetical protein [Planococcus lenghuensis]
MQFLRRLDERGALYPVTIVFFFAALSLLLHTAVLYTIQYRTYDGLENTYRRATILLLESSDVSAAFQEHGNSRWLDEEDLFNRIYGMRQERDRQAAELHAETAVL